MSEKSHEALVEGQFGARAEAYLKSAVHAQGPDLEAIAHIMRGRDNARVLDLGCGGGHLTFNVSPFVKEVVAYDLSQGMLDIVERTARERGLGNVTTQLGVAENLAFKNNSFDAVLSRFSAHHWHDLDAGIREAARVLKSGGTLAIIDTVTSGIPVIDTYFQAIELLRDCSHVRNYTRAEWEAGMARAGFLPRSSSAFRLRLDFNSWVERMQTPSSHIEAIRSLQKSVSTQVTNHFDTEPDGSFKIDLVFFEAIKLCR